jgi:SnoaL-like domain
VPPLRGSGAVRSPAVAFPGTTTGTNDSTNKEKRMSLSAEQMYELASHHARLEVQHDFDSVLATMTEDAYYEFYPHRIHVTGADNLKAMWTQIFVNTPGVTSADFVGGNPQEQWWGLKDSLVIKTDWTTKSPDGTTIPSQFFAIFRFAGSKIASETLYVDEPLSLLMDRVFTAELLARPGVTRFGARNPRVLPA